MRDACVVAHAIVDVDAAVVRVVVRRPELGGARAWTSDDILRAFARGELWIPGGWE
jgi:hypothetical protein